MRERNRLGKSQFPLPLGEKSPSRWTQDLSVETTCAMVALLGGLWERFELK